MAVCSKSTSMATPDLIQSAFQPLRPCGDYNKVNIKQAQVVYIGNQPEDHHSSSNTSNNELILSIKESLKDRYRRKEACMLSLLWDDDELDYPLEGYCVDLKVEEKDLMGTSPEGNIISLDKIFFSDDEYGRRSKRHILITGDAGYGKTTLAKKLSYDWATLDPGSYISLFDMLVNIPLMATGHQRLEESIRNTLDIDEETNNIIIDMKLRWLIILDGLDEARNPKLALSFLENSVRGYYPNSTIIVTSRPYAVKDAKRLFDRRLCILGLSRENQTKYIKAVFSPNTDKGMAIIKVIENDAFLQKASECPLLLHMMCCVYGIDNEKETPSITSRTTLYLQILKLLRIRYVKKHGETDIIENNIFIKLGKVAYDYLNDYNHITEKVLRKEFSKEDDYNVALGLGILCGLPIRYQMKVILKYEFFHRTFAEFLEAIYILHLVKQSSQDLSLVLANSFGLCTPMFVAGLMGSKFIENKPIFQWIAKYGISISELYEITHEADLDYESWERLSSLVPTIVYHHTSIERNLLLSGYTLNHLREIKIITKIVDEDFWKCAKQIIHKSNIRARIFMELPVSVAELASFELNVMIRFINMENMMSELIYINDILFEKQFFFVEMYIDPAKFSRRMEDQDYRTARIIFKEFCDLLEEPFSISTISQITPIRGDKWQFGEIEICYPRQFSCFEVKENTLESVNIIQIPILVMTEDQYSSIRKKSALDHNNLKVVVFKDVSMCRRFDDLKTTLSLGKGQNIDVVKRLLGNRIDTFYPHGWSYNPKFVTLLKSQTYRQCCVI